MNMVKELILRGYSKYEISRKVKVSWNMVRLWELEKHKPSKRHQIRLEETLNNGKTNLREL